jgi:hypothetical protein
VDDEGRLVAAHVVDDEAGGISESRLAMQEPRVVRLGSRPPFALGPGGQTGGAVSNGVTPLETALERPVLREAGRFPVSGPPPATRDFSGISAPVDAPTKR